MATLMQKLKSPQSARIQQIHGKPLNGNMLLGLALEYVEAINNQEIPVVMSCFERVVQVESRRFTEKLFEEVCLRLKTECNQEFMPYEDDHDNIEEGLEVSLRNIIHWAD